jgi:hypothetical protein
VAPCPESMEPASDSAATQPRKRRGTKRSRTGCLTCKLRKVKCDEARPICNRCITFGIGCDGYDAPRVQTKASVKAVVHQPLQRQKSYQILPAPPRRWSLESDLERLHLKAFETDIAPELAGVFDSAFWSGVVLQASHGESFVRSTIMALSAFGTAERIATQNALVAGRHREFALIQYQKGLQRMRIELTKEANARKALIGCLLICAIEGIFGNTNTALTHARSGQKLIQEWLASHPYENQHHVGVASPASHLIEDDLLQATSGFEHQKLGYFDSRKPEEHARIKRESNVAFDSMPKAFAKIEEARRYFYLVSRRLRHFWMYRNGIIENAQKARKEGGEESKDGSNDDCESDDGKAEGSYAEKGADNQVSAVSVDRRPMVGQDDTTLESFQAEEEQHIREFARWQSAFRELYRTLKKSTDKRQVIAAHTLYVQCVSCQISCTIARDMSNCLVDQHLGDFQEMLTISRKIIMLKKETFRSRFNFELGINPILLMTAQLCRSRTLRREAVALLRLHDCREGIWDSTAMAEIGEYYIALEEEGVETEFIPESARIRVLNLAFDQGKRVAKISYSRGPTFTRDNFTQATVTW